MRRDELKQPLHKRSLSQRLWGKRPTALTCAYCLVLASFVGGGIWATKQPMPFAGEPIVMVAVPLPVAEVKVVTVEALPDDAATDTASIDQAPLEKAKVTIEPPVEQDTYQQDATIFVSPKIPLTKAKNRIKFEARANNDKSKKSEEKGRENKSRKDIDVFEIRVDGKREKEDKNG